MKYIKQKYQKVVKNFNYLIKKNFLKLQSTIDINVFNKFKTIKHLNYLIKNTFKYLNYLIKKTLFKHRNKTNNIFINNFKVSKFKVAKSNISNFNKYLIGLIALLFLYLFYLSIPTLYNKTWVQNTIENKLINEFKINFSISSEISYEILPSPHFTIKNVKIINNSVDAPKELAEIKKLKIFISQKNLFDKDRLKIKRVLIDKANFSIQKSDFSYFNEFNKKKFSNKKINIRNSNIFFKNDDNETISIIKIPKSLIFYNEIKSRNQVNIIGEIFNIPFVLNLDKKIMSSQNISELDINAKKLKLKINNKSQNNFNKIIDGLNIFSITNSKLITKYKFENNLMSFESENSKIKNSDISYKGKLNMKPFSFIANIDLEKINLIKFFDINSIFLEIVKSKMLFNENVSTNISLNIDNNIDSKLFDSSKIVFNISNGKIDFNYSELINNKIGKLIIDESNLYLKDDELIAYSEMSIKIKDSEKFFSLFQTPKKARKPIEKIFIRMEYNFFQDQIKVFNFKIDTIEPSDEVKSLINSFNGEKNNNLNNFIIGKSLFNRFFLAYDG